MLPICDSGDDPGKEFALLSFRYAHRAFLLDEETLEHVGLSKGLALQAGATVYEIENLCLLNQQEIVLESMKGN